MSPGVGTFLKKQPVSTVNKNILHTSPTVTNNNNNGISSQMGPPPSSSLIGNKTELVGQLNSSTPYSMAIYNNNASIMDNGHNDGYIPLTPMSNISVISNPSESNNRDIVSINFPATHSSFYQSLTIFLFNSMIYFNVMLSIFFYQFHYTTTNALVIYK